MAFNGAGTFSRIYNWVTDAAANIKIQAVRMDAEMDGFATGLTTCVTKDGQTTPTANLPMGTFRHTGVGDSSSLTSYPSTKQVQNGAFNYVLDTGAADAYVCTLSPAPSTYVAGLDIYLKIANTNTGASTVNANSLGAKDIKTWTGAAMTSGMLGSGSIAHLKYNGTYFELISGQGWADVIKVNRSGDTMTGPLVVPASASGSQVPRASEVGLLASANAWTNNQTISHTAPQVVLIETDAAADNKRWDLLASAENMSLRVVNDANTVTSDILTITRTGTTIDSVTIGGTTVIVTGGQLKFPATQVPSSDVNTLDDYQEGSFTATFSGFSTSPTATVYYVKTGKQITLSIGTPISATSNSTTKAITGLPSELWPAANATVICGISDNGGAYKSGYAYISPGDGVLRVYNGIYTTLWTASGTAVIDVPCFSYSL